MLKIKIFCLFKGMFLFEIVKFELSCFVIYRKENNYFNVFWYLIFNSKGEKN